MASHISPEMSEVEEILNVRRYRSARPLAKSDVKYVCPRLNINTGRKEIKKAWKYLSGAAPDGYH